MKKLLATLSMLALTVGVLGQGQVLFLNFDGAGVDAKVQNAAGDDATSAYMAQLYAGPDENSLAAVGSAADFLDAVPGVVSGGVVTIDTISAGGAAAVQLRAWAKASGSSWEEASGNPTGEFGSSPTLNLASTGNPTSSPPGTPVPLNGLQGFQMTVVPEPSTWALLALGIGALALRRRK